MNDENQKPSGLDEKKKSALIHYVAILFIVAFIIVLISMLGTMRDSREDISALTQSSVSALQKAEQLQDDNQTLQEENLELEAKIKELEAALEAQKQETSKAGQKEADLEATAAELEQELAAARDHQVNILHAYEELLAAMSHATPGSQEGNVTVSRALENLENLKQYLGQNGLEEYESLLEEGE